MIHAHSVPKRLAIAEPSNRAAVCCSPRAKLPAKHVTAYAALFKALSDETRLDILGFLAAAGDAICVCEIEGHVKLLSQPTISHHLRQLRQAGLVTAERRGTWIYYAIDQSMRARLTEFVALFERRP
jgi:ArsR family transcriptional regulator